MTLAFYPNVDADGPERDLPRVEGERHRPEREDSARVPGEELQSGDGGHRGAHRQAGHQGQYPNLISYIQCSGTLNIFYESG